MIKKNAYHKTTFLNDIYGHHVVSKTASARKWFKVTGTMTAHKNNKAEFRKGSFHGLIEAILRQFVRLLVHRTKLLNRLFFPKKNIFSRDNKMSDPNANGWIYNSLDAVISP